MASQQHTQSLRCPPPVHLTVSTHKHVEIAVLGLQIPRFWLYSLIPNPNIGAVPIPEYWDYKNVLKLYIFSSVK